MTKWEKTFKFSTILHLLSMTAWDFLFMYLYNLFDGHSLINCAWLLMLHLIKETYILYQSLCFKMAAVFDATGFFWLI